MDIGGAVVRREAVASGRPVGREGAKRTRRWLVSVLPPPLIVIPVAALLGILEEEGAIPWVYEDDVDLGHFSMRLGPMYTR